MIESQLSQIEVDRASESFRRIHQERQELLNQLENSVKNMRTRDEEIADCQKHLQSILQQLREQQDSVNTKKNLLEEQEHVNFNLEKEIGTDERQVAQFKSDYTELKNDLADFQSEVEALKLTLHKSKFNSDKFII